MDLEHEISKMAYEIYESEGRPDGRDLDHWLKAEQVVRSRSGREESHIAPDEGREAKKTANRKTPARRKNNTPSVEGR